MLKECFEQVFVVAIGDDVQNLVAMADNASHIMHMGIT
jgi:hypothetical protein